MRSIQSDESSHLCKKGPPRVLHELFFTPDHESRFRNKNSLRLRRADTGPLVDNGILRQLMERRPLCFVAGASLCYTAPKIVNWPHGLAIRRNASESEKSKLLSPLPMFRRTKGSMWTDKSGSWTGQEIESAVQWIVGWSRRQSYLPRMQQW